MSKQSVLIVHPRVRPAGGGNLVAAWILQALRKDFEVSLATLEPVDYLAVNRSFGTCLRHGDFEVHLAPARYRRILRYFPTPGALLEICLTMRWAQDLDRRRPYDVLFGTENEADFHRRGIQYVHYPCIYLPRPPQELRWFHRIPGTLWTYRTGCLVAARASMEGLRRNLTLANSRFVTSRIFKVHGTDSLVVYPPVVGDFPEVPWERRRVAMAALGRLHPTKRWDVALEIVESVRRRGHNLSLTVIGHGDDLAYTAWLQSMAAARPWFRVLCDLDRGAMLAELGTHRYGIHPMIEEHFGIGPAELQRAGCITFVHNSGGPVEIVGGDARLTFDGVEDAAGRIARVLESQELECELRSQVAERKGWFAPDTFCKSVREIVAGFASDQAEYLTYQAQLS